mmetsp:Transcript_60073/g.159773  ORF Transcript_60073/g.159773 Transcript_60073/m.159773 type:complete len:209 (+) Transcript_60073:1779-2405(+)
MLEVLFQGSVRTVWAWDVFNHQRGGAVQGKVLQPSVPEVKEPQVVVQQEPHGGENDVPDGCRVHPPNCFRSAATRNADEAQLRQRLCTLVAEPEVNRAEAQDNHRTDAQKQTLTKVVELQEHESIKSSSLHHVLRRTVGNVAAQGVVGAGASVVTVHCWVQPPQHGEDNDRHERHGAIEHDGAAEGLEIPLSVLHDAHNLRRCPVFKS